MNFFRVFLGVALYSFVSWAAAVTDYATRAQSFRATLEDMVAADTSNPPGNESRIVKIVEKRLDAAGIPYQTEDFGPGRSDIVARLKGAGKEKPLLLLAHIDVVGTTHQNWTSDPHKVTERDGYLFGRGVADDLSMAAVELETFISLKQEQVPLRRDVILALTGDEEAGGAGITYLLQKHPDWLDASIALNEGGGVFLGQDGKPKFMGLQTAEKSYQDFTVSTKGVTGHSSVPMADNAIYRLAKALDRLSHYSFPAHLLPVTRSYFQELAKFEKGKTATAMQAVAKAKGKLPANAVAVLEKDPVLAVNLRTTCVATLIGGGTHENALPAVAKANVNCRILPDESIESVRARLASVVDDPKVGIAPATSIGVAGASPGDGEVPKAVEKITAEMWPGVPIIDTMSHGATDSRFLRMRGVQAYGIDPIGLSEEDERRMHGIDERIAVASIRPGLEFFNRLVLDLAGATPAS